MLLRNGITATFNTGKSSVAPLSAASDSPPVFSDAAEAGAAVVSSAGVGAHPAKADTVIAAAAKILTIFFLMKSSLSTANNGSHVFLIMLFYFYFFVVYI